MKKILLIALIGSLLGITGSYFVTNTNNVLGAFSDPFISLQLATSPSNGDCLTTDGTNNIWDTCAAGGGSGGGTWSTTTSQVAGQLINYSNNDDDVVAIGDNSTTTAEFWFDPNILKAYFTGILEMVTNSSSSGLSVSNAGSGDVLSILKTGSGNSFTVDTNEFLIDNNGRVGMGTSTPGTILSLGNTGANTINISQSATSTFGRGINLNTGCFAIAGTCIGGSGGSGTVNSGTAGQVPFYQSSGTTLTATSTLFISTGGLVGINNTSPATELDITGTGGATTLRISAPTFQSAGINFMPTGGASAKAWSIQTDHGGDFDIINNSTGLFTIAGNVDGGGTGYVGIASTTPGSNLAIGTSTTNFINLSTTGTSTYARGINLRSGCFAVNDVCISGGGGGSGTVGSGTTGQFPYYAGAGTTLTATSGISISTAGNVGIATTSPTARLEVLGLTSGTIFNLYSSTGTKIMEVLNSAVTTLLGIWDFTNAVLVLPNSSNPTLTAVGQLAHDNTSDNLVATSTTGYEYVAASATSSLFAFNLASTSPDFGSGGVIPYPADGLAKTALSVICKADGGTSFQMFLSDGTNDTNTVTCTNTSTQFNLTTNNSWNAYEDLFIEFGTVTGAIDYKVIRVMGYKSSN